MTDLAGLVRLAAGHGADRPAFVLDTAAAGDPAGRLTWGQLDAAVDDCARALQALGLQPGDRVGLVLGNTLDFPVCYFGVLRAGLVAVPANTGFTVAELTHVLTDSGARAVLAGPAAAQVVTDLQDAAPALEHVLVVGGPAGPGTFGEPVAGGPVDAPAGGEATAVVLYTSGTSGRPRGAMLSHRALLASLEQTARIAPPVVQAEDVVLLVLPLFHVFGLNSALGMVVRNAATGVLVERFDPVETLQTIRRHQVTGLVGAPPMYVAWSMLPDVGDAFTSVRLCLSGAAPLPATVLQRVLDVTGHHVFEGYGLTETAPTLTSTLMSEVAKPDSIGRPVPGIELKLLDQAGAPVEEGDPGEIVVRGDNLFSGYWPDGVDRPGADGWWATGDVAITDADGDLHLVDRRRELVLVSGFNVYPREVEAVLATHPDVAEAAVIGIPHPYTGESVKAIVVARPGTRPTGADLIAHCARSLARFKCPTAVELVPELPHSATGKVSKGRLRELRP